MDRQQDEAVDQHIEAVIDRYFDGQRDLVTQLVEDQTDALLVAVLAELQALNGDSSPSNQTPNVPAQRSSADTASYDARTVTVKSSEQMIDWGFEVDDVLLFGATEPIVVAFKAPEKDYRDIPLETSELPYNAAPEGGGLSTEKMWYRLDSTNTETDLTVVSF